MGKIKLTVARDKTSSVKFEELLHTLKEQHSALDLFKSGEVSEVYRTKDCIIELENMIEESRSVFRNSFDVKTFVFNTVSEKNAFINGTVFADISRYTYNFIEENDLNFLKLIGLI